MGAAAIDARFDAGLGGFARRLASLAAQAQELVAESVVSIGRATAERAAALTPRSESPDVFIAGANIAPPDGHIADRWVSEATSIGGGDVTVRVHNTHPRANAPIALEGGGQTTLLQILEYGSRPHEIRAKNAPWLVFYWPRIGAIVRAKVVHHPGTRPYAMLGLARVDAQIAIKRTLDALRTAIRLSTSGNAKRLRQPGQPFGGR